MAGQVYADARSQSLPVAPAAMNRSSGGQHNSRELAGHAILRRENHQSWRSSWAWLTLTRRSRRIDSPRGFLDESSHALIPQLVGRRLDDGAEVSNLVGDED